MITLRDPVFAPRQKTAHDITIPDCIRKCAETGRLDAFRLQWKKGEPNQPHVYWDSDVAKVLEGMAQMLKIQPDPDMEKELDSLVDLIISAQQPDGYLNVHFTVVEPENRWKFLSWAHELYCAGHLIEAAVAHFQATGKQKFLHAMCRYADYIDSVFGREDGKKRGYPGHQELELALVKLYRITGEKRYLDLAGYFIDERGREPNYFSDIEQSAYRGGLMQIQAHKPVREHTDAVGHAVRAVYFYCAIADVTAETGNTELLHVAERMFDSIAEKRMYITGGIGSTCHGEQFTHDYALPNDTAYAESCAAIGLCLFAKRMLDITGHRKYADVLERSLYNNALSGISLSGDEYFYANLLEVNSTVFEQGNTCTKRRKWFNCSCCPTNYCRFLPQLGDFCFEAGSNEIRIDIPAAANISTDLCELEISGGYPYDGRISIEIRRGGEFGIALRIPGWCSAYTLRINGMEDTGPEVSGYRKIKRVWKPGDIIQLNLEMPVQIIYPNPNIAACSGRAAIQRGPAVYCLESTDNPGIILKNVILLQNPDFRTENAAGLPEQTIAIRCTAQEEFSLENDLYRTTPPQRKNVEICAIPYALWQNRGESSMQVFLRT